MGFIADWVCEHVEPGKRGLWLAKAAELDLFLETELRWEVSEEQIAQEVDQLMERICEVAAGPSTILFTGDDFANFVKSNLRHSRDYILRIKEREFDIIFQRMVAALLRQDKRQAAYLEVGKIRELLNERGLSIKAAAAAADVAETTLRNALNGKAVKRDTLESVAAALGAKPEEIMK